MSFEGYGMYKYFLEQQPSEPCVIERLRDALALILPMAKGYAHEHPVGDNAGKCAAAEELLRELDALKPQSSGA